MVYLLFSKVSYNKLEQPSFSFVNEFSGSFIHFCCCSVSPFWLQHDKGTLYFSSFVGKTVSYFGLVQSAYPSTPQQLSCCWTLSHDSVTSLAPAPSTPYSLSELIIGS